ncbi:MAG TPA: SDR family NAD(P)-dependent oxidoreductase [bacterium]|nr:SDR family NAD(P)-dependent oxidoreductase [bacterium]
MGELQGVRALVTGAGRGIGRAIAMRLAAGGARVAVADLFKDELERTAGLVREAGGEALTIIADVTKQDDVERMVAEAVKAFGGLDVLVNNAGVSTAGFIESVRDEDVERVLSVNLVGALRVTRAAAPHLKKSGRGRIINMSSVEGIRGSGLVPVYSSSKAGLLGLTRSNAIELARFNVTVNAVCPGPIDTDMLAPLMADPRFREKVSKGVPLKRLGKPEDVAAAVAFFASEEAGFITGNALVVDGGMTVKAL